PNQGYCDEHVNNAWHCCCRFDCAKHKPRSPNKAPERRRARGIPSLAKLSFGLGNVSEISKPVPKPEEQNSEGDDPGADEPENILVAHYFFSGSGATAVSSSRIAAAAAMRSPSSRRSRRTPCVERPASRISPEWTRMTLPWPVMIITSESSRTCKAATTVPFRSVDLRLMTPLPPREVTRYSASGVRFP